MTDFLTSLFLESPWRLGIFSFLLFAVVLFARLRIESQRVRDWSLPATLLAIVLLFIIQSAVETDRERIIARLSGFVAAIEKPDIDALGGYISMSYDAEDLDRDEFLESLESWLKHIDIQGTRYRRRDVTIDGVAAELKLGAMATVFRNGSTGETHFGTWTIDWALESGEWKIRSIQIEMIDGQPISDMRRQLSR